MWYEHVLGQYFVVRSHNGIIFCSTETFFIILDLYCVVQNVYWKNFRSIKWFGNIFLKISSSTGAGFYGIVFGPLWCINRVPFGCVKISILSRICCDIELPARWEKVNKCHLCSRCLCFLLKWNKISKWCFPFLLGSINSLPLKGLFGMRGSCNRDWIITSQISIIIFGN